MKRLTLISVAVLLLALAASACFAQTAPGGRTYGPGNYTNPKHDGSSNNNSNAGMFYVVVEKTGIDITPTLYGTLEQVKEHAADVLKQNNERKAANKSIDEEVRKLKAELAAKEHAAASTKDADTKAELQTAIQTLKDQISQKESARQALTTLFPPQQFRTREDAEKYMEAVNKEAQKVREKAEAKHTT
jgi:predicted transcriptional regulator